MLKTHEKIGFFEQLWENYVNFITRKHKHTLWQSPKRHEITSAIWMTLMLCNYKEQSFVWNHKMLQKCKKGLNFSILKLPIFRNWSWPWLWACYEKGDARVKSCSRSKFWRETSTARNSIWPCFLFKLFIIMLCTDAYTFLLYIPLTYHKHSTNAY